MIRVKKLFAGLLAMIIIILSALNTAVIPAFAFSPDFDIHSKSAIVVHLDTDITVFKKNQHEKIFPASTVKIMTALIVLENVSNLNEFVNVTNAMNDRFGENYNFEGAGVADFVVGQENLTYLDCLYALMIYSACDSANILAHNVGSMHGSGIPTFINMMNEKAKELGCVNTNFRNPHGLHEKDNYTSAYDMFLITKYAWEKYPVFREIVGTTGYSFPANSKHPEGITLPNTNRLLRNTGEHPHFYEFAKGVKTGSINRYLDLDTGEYLPGNFNLVSVASRNSDTYLIVTLGAPFYEPGTNERVFYVYDDHIDLYKWAFSTMEYQTIESANNVMTRIPVKNGQADSVQLQLETDFNYLLPNNYDKSIIHKEYTYLYEEPEAPVEKGERLGHVEFMREGEVLAKIHLLARDDVARLPEQVVIDNFQGILKSAWFWPCVAIVAALAIFVFVLRIMNKSRMKNRSHKVKRNKISKRRWK